MELTGYQKVILAWLYGLQNNQGIFANAPPPPEEIVPPPVSQAPGGEAWLAFGTTAGERATDPNTVRDIPGTRQNDPQAAIAAMPRLVTQVDGTLLLTLDGVLMVESLIRAGVFPELSEEALANIDCRLGLVEAAEDGASPSDRSPRWNTNANLLARAGLIGRDGAGAWRLTD